MKCTKDTFDRVEAARKLLASNGFISERENPKVARRIKQWVRESGKQPSDFKKEEK